MKNKVVLITGANSGTGKWTAIALAQMGAQVVMLCRDQSRGEEALKDVKEISGSQDVEFMLCDLASLESIRAFCHLFKSKYKRLDILVNKAGNIHFDNINLKKGFTMPKAYAQSKLANVLFTYELARRLKEKSVTVNALHPGAVASNIAINRDTGFGKLIIGALRPFFKRQKKAPRPLSF